MRQRLRMYRDLLDLCVSQIIKKCLRSSKLKEYTYVIQEFKTVKKELNLHFMNLSHVILFLQRLLHVSFTLFSHSSVQCRKL